MHAYRHRVLHRRASHRGVPRWRTPRGAVAATLVVLAVPAATGPADPGAATAMPAPAGGFQPHLLQSPFGTVDAPTFRFPGLTATAPAAADPDDTEAGADAPEAAADRDDAEAPDASVAMRVVALPDDAADPDAAAPPPPDADAGFHDRRPRTPAELLNLSGDTRARHERCLANAIYFEARGEPLLGQMAVAQVVINRVFSGHYPGDVCGVVYQSTRRYHRLRCQFSFTCDGIPDRITEPDAFERATRVARNALDGRFWVDDVGKATHYHARWVHPRWVHEMRRLDRIGVHTFYRPRRWGSGATAPAWGDQAATEP